MAPSFLLLRKQQMQNFVVLVLTQWITTGLHVARIPNGILLLGTDFVNSCLLVCFLIPNEV